MTERLRQAINKITEFHYLVQELRWSSFKFQQIVSRRMEWGKKSNGKTLAAPTPFFTVQVCSSDLQVVAVPVICHSSLACPKTNSTCT